MWYKLFIFGENKVFAWVTIPGGEHLKSDDIILFKNERYKVIWNLRSADEMQFDDNGNLKITIWNQKEVEIKNSSVSELYVTLLPQF